MARSRVKVWEDQVTIPTYPLHPDDMNPRFFELEGTLIYPYTMQDHLSRTKADRAYRALHLENEYFVVMCLPARRSTTSKRSSSRSARSG